MTDSKNNYHLDGDMRTQKYIDILKGIAILFVVIGHAVRVKTVFAIIFSFHMPLFFFISGYLFKPNNNIKQFFIKKSVKLLIPYISFLIFFNILTTVRDILFRPNLINFVSFVKTGMKQLYGGAMLDGYFGVFWFITYLFLHNNFLIYWY